MYRSPKPFAIVIARVVISGDTNQDQRFAAMVVMGVVRYTRRRRANQECAVYNECLCSSHHSSNQLATCMIARVVPCNKPIKTTGLACSECLEYLESRLHRLKPCNNKFTHAEHTTKQSKCHLHEQKDFLSVDDLLP